MSGSSVCLDGNGFAVFLLISVNRWHTLTLIYYCIFLTRQALLGWEFTYLFSLMCSRNLRESLGHKKYLIPILKQTMVTQTCHPRTREAEAGALLWSWSQSGPSWVKTSELVSEKGKKYSFTMHMKTTNIVPIWNISPCTCYFCTFYECDNLSMLLIFDIMWL